LIRKFDRYASLANFGNFFGAINSLQSSLTTRSSLIMNCELECFMKTTAVGLGVKYSLLMHFIHWLLLFASFGKVNGETYFSVLL